MKFEETELKGLYVIELERPKMRITVDSLLEHLTKIVF